ncbi:MAG: hypothetical protein AAF430_19170 [Myxococcota bacterium]
MFDPVRWPSEAWVPLVSGLGWLAAALSWGIPGGALALVPGVMLASAGGSMLLAPGDLRLPQIAALGGALGVVVAVLALFFTPGVALLLGGLSAGSALAAGHHALRLDPHPEGVPEPRTGLGVTTAVAIDEAILGTMALSIRFPTAPDHDRLQREVDTALEQFDRAGFLADPTQYHEKPSAPTDVKLQPRRFRDVAYEQLSFDSGYAPREGEPGRERWLAYAPNATAHAWVVRGDPAAPWLMAIHGYRMGAPFLDFGAFEPSRFRDRMGLNLLLPILPLHGPRKIGVRSGDGFLAGQLLDTVHAEAQAAWDLRRLLAWVRAQSDAPIGVYGLSLGGYNTALLSSLDEGLACAVAGIPATDFARTFYRHGGPWQQRASRHVGLTPERMREVLTVVSPLAMPSRVPLEHRAVFGGIVDRIVSPDQVRDLVRHWDEPSTVWYSGTHFSFRDEPDVAALTEGTLRRAGVAA